MLRRRGARSIVKTPLNDEKHRVSGLQDRRTPIKFPAQISAIIKG
jgi:hypothetical protein